MKQHSPPPVSTFLAVSFVLLLVLVGQLSIDIYLASLPAIAKELNVSTFVTKQTITIFLVGYALSQLVFGPLSDRFGRRPILFIGMSFYFLSTLGCMLATSGWMLLTARCLQGLSAGAPNVLSRAIMRDVFDGKALAKVSSYLAMLWALIPIVAPVSGGYIQSAFGWRANFAVLIGLSLIILTTGFLFAPETRPIHLRTTHSFGQSIKTYYELLINPLFIGNVLLLTFLLGIFFSLSVVGPFLFQYTLGLSPIAYGWVTLIISMGYLLGSVLNSYLLGYAELITVYKWGYAIAFCFGLIFVIAAMLGWLNTYIVVIPLFGVLFGMGLIYANGIAACLSLFHHIAGSASALYGCLALLGSSIESAIAAHLPIHSQLDFGFLVLILLSASLLLYCRVTYPQLCRNVE